MSLLDLYLYANKICIFSKSYCNYCNQAKNLLNKCNITPIIYELDKMPEGNTLQADLISKTNFKTVPNIFINGIHIGGFTELCKLYESGKIFRMINPNIYECFMCGKQSINKNIMLCNCTQKSYDDWNIPY